ncbi:MAG: hypothetical protein M1835_001408 [Candelina submexicana]|nr:MAG: hypothetical protein M1835_001408 [Candelina submexicana]
MSERATLIKPPPVDPSKSSIENVLELTSLSDIGPDVFTNTRPLWHPPGARGIFGGAVIAQCLSAAQKTIPGNFTVHSMHCYFVLAGDAEIPICYHVEHVREGKSFATRTVQARQRGKCIFTATTSFMREGSGGQKLLEHAVKLPEIPEPDGGIGDLRFSAAAQGPIQSQLIEIYNSALSTTRHKERSLTASAENSPYPHEKRTRQWMKARGTISPGGSHQAHLAALAYMSDSYFIGTVSRVHNILRFPSAKDSSEMKKLRDIGNDDNAIMKHKNEIGMMVSLDHTIYFHNPRDFRADEWLFTEMDSPWSGDGRGLVMQRIFTKGGKLVASCVQEGLVRLKQDSKATLSASKL